MEYSSQMEKLVMIEYLQDTYRDKKVFLTGHTGFKGSWMAFLLNHLGAKVKGYALKAEHKEALFHLLQLSRITESVINDIRDQKALEDAILEFQPDFIFHLAAQALVIDSYQFPVDTYSTNVMGTAHVLDAVRKMDKPVQVVIVTTDKVYENKEIDYAYKESDRLGGYDPYSSSKACAELLTHSYRQSYFHPRNYKLHQKTIATARSGNVIGGGDWSENRIVPDLVRAFSKKKPLIVRNPWSVRPWQHVLDPLSGYLMLGARMVQDPITFAEAYNFGPDDSNSMNVETLVQTAIDIWGSGSYEVMVSKDKHHEAGLLMLDINKAIDQLDWSPKLDAAEAIKMTLEWYQAYSSDPFAITFKQIVDYFNH